MTLPATKTGITPAEIQADYLHGLVRHLTKTASFSESYLWRKIRSQEDEMERDLGILWRETRIRSEPDPADTDFDLIEPGYDYSHMYFAGERWGYLKLRRAPVRSVQRVLFVYPNADDRVFDVPTKWIRLDQQWGVIRLVPDGASILANFSAFMLQVFSGGRAIPQAIFVDYTAGFISGVKSVADSLDESYVDLLEHLKYSVMVDVLRDLVLPDSQSISTDGQTQSFSVQRDKLIEEQHARRQAMKQKIKGVMMVVV